MRKPPQKPQFHEDKDGVWWRLSKKHQWEGPFESELEAGRSIRRKYKVDEYTGEPVYLGNPTTGMTAKGKRMYRHVKQAGGARAPSAVVYGAASRGAQGLVSRRFAATHGYPAQGRKPRSNPFMVPDYFKGAMAVGDDETREMRIVPWEYRGDVPWATPPEKETGWWAHLTAHGYLDQTEWGVRSERWLRPRSISRIPSMWIRIPARSLANEAQR